MNSNKSEFDALQNNPLTNSLMSNKKAHATFSSLTEQEKAAVVNYIESGASPAQMDGRVQNALDALNSGDIKSIYNKQ